MKILIPVLCIALVACGPSEAQLATAIAGTQAAIPTATSNPTITPIPPTATLEPTSTDVPPPTETEQSLQSLSQIQDEARQLTVDFLEGRGEIESVSLVRFGSGKLEIELRTIYFS